MGSGLPVHPRSKKGGRPAKYDRREAVNALPYLYRTGCQWRPLPHDFPPWGTAQWYTRNWKAAGVFDRLPDELRGDLRAAEGRHRQPSAVLIDIRSVKTTEKGGAAATTAGRRSPGGSDTSASIRFGLLMAVVVTAASVQDDEGAKLVFGAIRSRFSRLRLAWADAIYRRVADRVAAWRPARSIRRTRYKASVISVGSREWFERTGKSRLDTNFYNHARMRSP